MCLGSESTVGKGGKGGEERGGRRGEGRGGIRREKRSAPHSSLHLVRHAEVHTVALAHMTATRGKDETNVVVLWVPVAEHTLHARSGTHREAFPLAPLHRNHSHICLVCAGVRCCVHCKPAGGMTSGNK